MAKKKGNPLSGKFRDPPQEGNASAPEPVEQDTDQVKLADAMGPEQTDQGDIPGQAPEVPADPVAADAPALEQTDQDEAPAEPPEVPAEPVAADAPAPEQADQGEAPAVPREPPADPVAADAPAAPEQADQGEVPVEPPELSTDPVAAAAPAPEQVDQGEAPAEPPEPSADPVTADVPAAPEQTDQGEVPGKPPEPPADPVAADTPTPQHPEARFVKLADIAPLSGTYVKDTPRDDYTELLDSIKANGLEKPIILRQSEKGNFQLVDGFHRCEAMKQVIILCFLSCSLSGTTLSWSVFSNRACAPSRAWPPAGRTSPAAFRMP